MLKKVLIGLAVLVAIIAVVAYYIISNIDAIAKNVIEESGTKVLGTEVTVGSVEVKLREGKATIKHLNVANPAGYSDHLAFSFAEVTAEIEIHSGVIKRIYSGQPEIWVEFKDGKSNFDVLNKNIEASAKEGGADQKSEDGGGRKAISVQIDEVVVEKAKATVIRNPGDEPMELTIARLQFENLKGSPQQITRVMLGQFVTQVIAETARKMLEKRASDLIEKQGDEIKEKLKSLLQ